jgi:CheY-like chemotaxis protein
MSRVEDLPRLLQGKRVLVIDDEKYSRSLVSDYLHDTCQVVTANSGADGLVKLELQGRTIAAVICDFSMPGMNGLQVLKAIRTGFSGIANDLPVFLLTAQADTRIVHTAMALGVDAFLVKPISKQILLGHLAQKLGAQRALKTPAKYALVNVDVPSDQRVSLS